MALLDPIQTGSDNRIVWRKVNELLRAVATLQKQVFTLLHPDSRRTQTASSRLEFPFEIYQSGDWLHFTVRTGMVITTGASVGLVNLETEFTVDAGVVTYVYLNDIFGTPTILSATTMPAWSAAIIPIGWIDTTNEADEVAVITQFCTTHIFSPCQPAPPEEEE